MNAIELRTAVSRIPTMRRQKATPRGQGSRSTLNQL